MAGCGPDHTVAMAGKTRITQSQLTTAVEASQVLQGVHLDRNPSAKKSQAATLAEQAVVTNWAFAHHVITENQAATQARNWISHHIAPQLGGQANLTQRLSANHLSLGDFQHYIAQQMVLQAAYSRVTDKIPPPTLADEQRYYQNNSAFYVSPAQVLLRDISVSSRSEADSIVSQLKKGASFGALALRDSKDAYRNQGGSRGWIQLGASSALPAAWRQAISHLPTGRLSIVKGPLGYSIIEVQASRSGATIPFHAVEPAIHTELVQSAKTTMFDGWAANLMKTEKVRLMST